MNSESHRPAQCEWVFQQPVLMFAFKGPGVIILSAAADGAVIGAHGRRQDPKTPVEQALMRGLGTA
jgi:hypothetical protein